MNSMHISDIEIKNFKGFVKCNIDFHPKLNVFIGSNASGKTTLLNALLNSIYSITSSFNQTPKASNLPNSDLNYNATFGLIKATIRDFPSYNGVIQTGVHSKAITHEDARDITSLNANKNNFVTWYTSRLRQAPATIPIFKFYPANRGAIKYSQNLNLGIYLISQLETWSNIYQDSVSYSRFFNWFFENETNELRLQRDANNFALENPSLRDVRMALHKAFEFIGYTNFKIKIKQEKRQGNSKLIPNLILKNPETNEEESIDNKSDGEKAIISLIADIAFNLSLAKDFVNDDHFLNSPGVVLIDEIETHLHPNWQRKIIPMLTAIFPNIQFFIATHSPQVIASVKSENVFALDNFIVNKVNLKTLGEDSNSLLKYIFNSTDRPLKYVHLLEEFQRLMEENAPYANLREIINKVKVLDREDNSNDISNLLGELNLQLESYKFDKEHEENK
jgi:predicted ATP-binding protein involved in virulence